MLSLVDVFDRDEVEAWVKRIEKLLGHEVSDFFVEIKKDGLAGSVIYQDGVIVQGLTRGDGRVGEDITKSMRTIETVPLKLRRDDSVPPEAYRGRFEVRGEILLYKADFEALNAQRKAAGLPLFANPRNTAAGTIRQLDAKLVAERNLRFMVYIVETKLPGLTTLAEEQAVAHAAGMLVEQHGRVVKGIDGIMQFIDDWSEKRHDLPFGTDGIVITVNDTADFDRLGVVGKAPRGAVAFKYPAEQTTTKLKDIMISIGRTGAATPFAVLEPVKVAGSTVGLATLHNESEIARKDIRIGDTIILQKAGDIIPEIVEPLVKLRDGSEKVFVMPKNCPVCGHKLDKRADEAIWRCVNFDCPALESGRIEHFASKNAYDIEGMGEQTVEALLDAGLITDAADLFSLTVEQLLTVDRFAQKSAENLYNGIQARKTITLDRYIYALGIRHVGQQTARDLATFFGSLDHFRQAQPHELDAVAGIGPVVSASLSDWLSSDRHRSFLAKLDKAGVKPEARKRASGPLVGQSFVITGSLRMGSRDEVGAQLEALGATVQNSVTKTTTYLVIGDDPGGSKLTKAEKLGTKQLDEEALGRLLKS
jgi:DNA ligase (NAD+)